MFFPACAISFFQVVQVVIRGESVRGGGTGGADDAAPQKGRLPPWRLTSFFQFICLALFDAADTGDNIQALSKYNLRSAAA